MPPRVLILTASVGEGHDLPARTLAAQIRAERPDADVITRDALEPMGRLVTAISADAPRLVFFRFQWLWDLGFWVFAGFGPTRRGTQALLTRLGGRGLLRMIEEVDPDVIACTYPNTTEVLGRLRRSGRLRVPVCAAITDLAAMHYWASPGIDVHLITHPESVAEVREVAGETTRVECVHGLTAPEFLAAHDQRAARAALGLPLEGKIVLVSGGGWGVGDVGGAVEDALDAAGVTQVVCLCGRNELLLRRVREQFAGNARVRVEGFTDRMADWMAAADVLVHSTGGLTVLEALMLGLPPISYGWGRGHVRVNNAAFRQFGLAAVAGTREELAPALHDALARGRLSANGFHGLPSAASIVLEAAAPIKSRAVS
ncbi:MAG TPA: glycosyltransferase [Gaiellaceae bacterium]|jgi:UDP-N-acetylglucosamine:LPS N-acetylglucosamine transferase|nr:glycosyltransferase [Gaiellaceae bacterium]